MEKYIHRSYYFYGHEVSDYGKKHGYIDYRTLSKCFDAVLNNDIMQKTCGTCGEWEQVNGFIDNSDELDELQERMDDLLIDFRNEETEAGEKKLLQEIDELQEKIDELTEEQETARTVFQWYIISDEGARILQELTDEILYYNDFLDMYVWGVAHYGTSWDCVLTDIKIEMEGETR